MSTSTTEHATDDPAEPGAARPSRRLRLTGFDLGLAAVTVVGFAVRVVYVMVKHRHDALAGDAQYFSLQGKYLALGHGFLDPFRFALEHKVEPSAAHPPLYSLYLAASSLIGFDTYLSHRIAACLLGAATVVVIGIVARRLAGPAAGLSAAAIAAVFPALWISDAVALSESLVALTTALMLLAAYAFWDDPSWRRAAFLGGAIALVTLTRAEGILFYGLLALPLAIRVRGLDVRARVQRLVVAGAVGVVLMAPWIGYNLVRFEEPTFLSTGAGGAALASSCDDVFYGPHTGWWSIDCVARVDRAHPSYRRLDESQRDVKFRDLAREYVGDHKRRLPKVVVARVARLWGLYQPYQTAVLDLRGLGATEAAYMTTWALLPLGGLGVVVAWRRRRPVLPLLAPVVMVTLTAAIFYGNPRFRAPGDVSLVVAAGVGVAWLGSKLRRGRAASDERAGG